MPRTELIRIPCNTGINQSSGIDGGGFGTCENFRSGGTGEALVKRTGLKRYAGTVYHTEPQITGDGTSTAVENCSFLAQGGTQNAIGVSSGAAHCLDASGEIFAFAGRFSTCKPIRRDRMTISRFIDTANSLEGFGATAAHCAVNSDDYTLVFCSPTAGRYFYRLYDPDHRLVYQRAADGPIDAKVVAQGSVFYVIYRTGTALYAFSQTVSAASGLTPGSATQVATLNAAGDCWDVCYGTRLQDGNARWWLVYQYSGTYIDGIVLNGTTSLNHNYLSIGGVADSLSVQYLPLKSSSTYDNLWIGHNQSGTLDVMVVDESISNLIVNNQNIATGVTAGGPPLFGLCYPEGPGNTTTAFFAYRERITATAQTTEWNCVMGTVKTDGTVAVNDDTLCGVMPISKFDNYGRFWALLGSEKDETLMRCALLRMHDTANGIPVVELAAERSLATDIDAYGPPADTMWFGQIGEGASFFSYPLPFIIGDYNGHPQFAMDLMFYQGSEHDPHVSTTSGRTVVTANQPVEIGTDIAADDQNQYTTAGAAEIGWAMRPTILSATEGGGSFTFGLGTWKYKAVLEYSDALGRRHLSEPSAPVTLTTTTASGQSITVYVSPLKATLRNFSVYGLVAAADGVWNLPRMLLYRTVNGGTTYHRLPVQIGVMTHGGDRIQYFEDDYTDDDIADEQPLYTDGGVLPNDMAPACQFVARVSDRIWCGGLWEPSVIQCSKTIIPTEPINFADNDVFRVQLSGECTGLTGMDGRVVAFTRNTIETIGGEGPDERGSGYFSPPEILTSSIGCTNFRSVLLTDVGIIFQSGPGFFVLPRGFGPVQHIGDMIRDHVLTGNAAYCWASAVSAVGTDQIAAWLTSTGSGTLPEHLLVYDITRNMWFMDTLDGGTYRELGAWSTGLALCTSSLDSDDVSNPIAVQRFNSADTTDDGSTFIDAKAGTDTMHPFGVGGWGLVHSITVVFTGSGFTLNIDAVAEDHSQSASWVISSSDAINHRTMPLKHPELSALSIDVYDSAGGTDLSFSPLAIVLSVTPIDGVRPPDAGEGD